MLLKFGKRLSATGRSLHFHLVFIDETVFFNSTLLYLYPGCCRQMVWLEFIPNSYAVAGNRTHVRVS